MVKNTASFPTAQQDRIRLIGIISKLGGLCCGCGAKYEIVEVIKANDRAFLLRAIHTGNTLLLNYVGIIAIDTFGKVLLDGKARWKKQTFQNIFPETSEEEFQRIKDDACISVSAWEERKKHRG